MNTATTTPETGIRHAYTAWTESLEQGRDLTDKEARRTILEHASRDKHVRDAFITSALDGQACAQTMTTLDKPDGIAAHLMNGILEHARDHMDGHTRNRIDTARRIMRRTVGEAIDEQRPARMVGTLVSTEAWLAWAQGDTDHAFDMAIAALETNPADTLAQIVASVVKAGKTFTR